MFGEMRWSDPEAFYLGVAIFFSLVAVLIIVGAACYDLSALTDPRVPCDTLPDTLGA